MNKIKPDISLCGSSYRPENWMALYKSIGDNDVSFEIIFVGPNEPGFELPSNIKFIKSYVKPPQCIEIATRNAAADLVMNISDDVEFKTKRPLDRLYNLYKSRNNEKLMVSCRYMLDGEDLSNDCHYFFPFDKNSPVLPLSGLMSSKLYKEIGGIDRNFIAMMGDLDVAMRIHALAGEIILSDVYLEEVKSKSRGSLLCIEYWKRDRGMLESLWVVNGKVQLTRTMPVEPFSDFKILEESQGPRGRWRGSSLIMLEKLADIAHFCFKDLPKRIPIIFRMASNGIRNPHRYPEYVGRIFRRLFIRKQSVITR